MGSEDPNLSTYLAGLALGLLVVCLGLVGLLWSALVAGLLWRSTNMVLLAGKLKARCLSASDIRFLRSLHIVPPR